MKINDLAYCVPAYELISLKWQKMYLFVKSQNKILVDIVEYIKTVIGLWNNLLTAKKVKKKPPQKNKDFTLHFVDEVLSLNNSRFGDFVNRIYPIELEINDTTDTDRSASYLDLHLKIVSEEQNITTKQMISIFPL
jgi:hypothetical protein